MMCLFSCIDSGVLVMIVVVSLWVMVSVVFGLISWLIKFSLCMWMFGIGLLVRVSFIVMWYGSCLVRCSILLVVVMSLCLGLGMFYCDFVDVMIRLVDSVSL